MGRQPSPGDQIGHWQVGAQLAPSHPVWSVSSDTIPAAVLKLPRALRAAQEVAGVVELNGQHGVMPTLDHGVHGGRPWFVMPEATPLAALFPGTAALGEVVRVFSSIASTLNRLVEQTSFRVHRDIKPDNLFWLDGSPVIADFGIARWQASASLTEAGERVGAAHFMAPEARSADPNHPLTASVDVYGLAQTLWAIARGEKYPPGGTLLENRPEFALNELRYLRHMSDGAREAPLRSLLQDATAFRPADRPTMAEFARELAAWCRLDSSADAPGSRLVMFEELSRRLAAIEREMSHEAHALLHHVANAPAGPQLNREVHRIDEVDRALSNLNPSDDPEPEPDHIGQWLLQFPDTDRPEAVCTIIAWGDRQFEVFVEWQSAGAHRALLWNQSMTYDPRRPSGMELRERLAEVMAAHEPGRSR